MVVRVAGGARRAGRPRRAATMAVMALMGEVPGGKYDSAVNFWSCGYSFGDIGPGIPLDGLVRRERARGRAGARRAAPVTLNGHTGSL